MSRRTLIIMFLAVLPCFVLSSCSHSQPVWPNKPGKRVLTTFTPLYCFTQAVAGDDANVMCLLTTHGPHGSDDVTTQDILKVRGADIVLANGLGLDEELIKKLNVSSGKKVKVYEVGEVLEKKHHDLFELGPMEHDHKHGDHDHGDHDPHVWLGPDRAKLMVDIIADKLSELDPAKKANFLKRAAEYKAKLDELKAYGKEKFDGKNNRRIVTQHDSLAHFAKEFNLTILGTIRTQAGEDQGTNKELIDKCKKDPPSVFTYEPQYPKKEVENIMATLKKNGINAVEAEVDTIETATMAEGSSNPEPGYYLERMKMNIDNLAKALK